MRYAGDTLTESVVVFNGDVLTQVDLAAVLRLHREREARATIVLTPVDNPSAYGLVETDDHANILRFLEKPKPEEITTNYINAGIYVLEPGHVRSHPEGHALVHRAQLLPVVHRARRDVRRLSLRWLLDRHRHAGEVHAGAPRHHGWALPGATLCRRKPTAHIYRGEDVRIEEGASVEGPAFLDAGTVVRAGASVGPYSVLGRACVIEEGATVSGSIVWPNGRIAQEASVSDALAGRHVHVGRGAEVRAGAVLGDKSVVTDYSRV